MPWTNILVTDRVVPTEESLAKWRGMLCVNGFTSFWEKM